MLCWFVAALGKIAHRYSRACFDRAISQSTGSQLNPYMVTPRVWTEDGVVHGSSSNAETRAALHNYLNFDIKELLPL